MIKKIVEFFEKHLILVFVIIAIAIAIPVVLIFLIHVFNFDLSFSIDGMLSYAGSIITGFISLFIGIIALYQGNRAHWFSKKNEYEQKRNNIFPDLKVSVENISEDISKITVENISINKAFDINLFGFEIEQLCFGEKDSIEVRKNPESEFFDRIMITYGDADDNCISISYYHLKDGRYSYRKEHVEYEENYSDTY